MSDPTKYVPGYSYSGWQASYPSKPLPAPQIDNDFANISQAVNGLVDAVKDVRRSDGKLPNGIVGPDAISPALKLGFTFRGAWEEGTAYQAGDGVVYQEAFYSARVRHTSSAENTPDDEAVWLFLFSIEDIVVTGALSMPRSSFTGDGSTTEFNLSFTPVSSANTLVAFDGVLQDPNEYTVAGPTIVFGSPPPLNVSIVVRGFATTSDVSVPADGSVSRDSLNSDLQTAVGKADTAVQPEALGNSASRNVGTVTGTVAAGDDTRIIGASQKSATQTNPTVPGWGVSFNPPSAPGYANGMAHTYTLTSATPNPVNGWLLNLIVDSSYNKDILGNVVTNPVAVGLNVEMQVQKANAGNDFWNMLGVLDFQASNTGGQAVAGIIRGNWTGTNLSAGLRAQAENYSGRSAYGVVVSASETDGNSAYFDNSFAYGVFVHKAKSVGVMVGGLQGAAQAVLPAKPFLFQTADGSQDIWSIVNNGGLTATMRLQGSIVLEDNTLPAIQWGAVTAPANSKFWQAYAAPDGTFSLRTLNDAQNAAGSVLRITRSGNSFSSIVFGNNAASIGSDGYVTAASGFKVGGNLVLGPRDTGWVAMTGTSNKATAYDTSTITLPQLAARVKALQDALTTLGPIGA
jgi:hypothetical protein